MATTPYSFFIALCHLFWGLNAIGPSSSSGQTGERVWEGACGNPAMSWKQLFATGVKYDVMDTLENHQNLLSSLEATYGRPFPWTFHIRTGTEFLQATMIRAIPDEEATDIAVTSAETCRIIKEKTSLVKKLFGMLSAVAAFGVHYKEHKGYLNVPIIDCFPFPIDEDRQEWHRVPDDISLVLVKRLPFSGNVKPACMPAENEPIQVGTPVTIPGCGHQNSGKLENIQIRVVKWSRCQGTFLPTIENSQSHFCIDISTDRVTSMFDEDDTLRRYCAFETGAPVLTEKDGKYVMLGIVTLKEIQRTYSNLVVPNLPAVVARMSHGPYQNWMEGIIKEKSELWKKHRQG